MALSKRLSRFNRNKIIAGIILSVFLVVYFFFDPVDYRWMPQCIFHRVTGLQCMGCGSQRVIHSLLHGDLGAAFQANALLVICLPGILFMVWLELNRKSYPRLYKRVHSKGFIIIVTAILAVWLFIRNILGI